MGYEDFVWFILSEEDKTTDTAIEYWFRCADLDCDGVITPSEMWHFYEEQMKRLEGLSQVGGRGGLSGVALLCTAYFCRASVSVCVPACSGYTIR